MIDPMQDRIHRNLFISKAIFLMYMKSSFKREKKKSSFLWVLFIVLLMFGSSIAYVFIGGFSNQPKQKSDFTYKGYAFTKTDTGWMFSYQNSIIQVDYLPTEVADFPFQNIPLTHEKVYLAFNATERDSNMDYSLRKTATFLKGRGYQPVLACIAEQDCPDIPVVSCKDTQAPILLFQKRKITQSSIEGSCLVLEGATLGLSKLSDRFLYALLGVM